MIDRIEAGTGWRARRFDTAKLGFSDEAFIAAGNPADRHPGHRRYRRRAVRPGGSSGVRRQPLCGYRRLTERSDRGGSCPEGRLL